MENNLTSEIEKLKKEVWNLAKNTIGNLENILANLDTETLAQLSSALEDLSELTSSVETNTSNISTLQSSKVDKVEGKSLSSNDYTTEEKQKLAGIEAGAKVNVQANWSESDSSSDTYIQNKPIIPTVNNATLTIQKEGVSVGTFSANASSNTTINLTETDPVFTASAAAGITSADITAWNNKQAKLTFDVTPTANSYNPVVSYGIKNAIDAKVDPADLASVATSGDYSDLINKPITSITYSSGTLTITI